MSTQGAPSEGDLTPPHTAGPVETPREREERGPQVFRALRSRDFRLLWIGLVVSQTGAWMQALAQGWLVYMLTDSPFYLGLVGFARAVPVIVFTLWGGVVADRMNRRKVMLVAQVVNMVMTFILAVLSASPFLQVWHVIVLAAISAAAMAFEAPSRQSLIPALVEKRDVINAIGLQSAAFNSAGVVGPAIGGIIVAWVGVAGAFFVNGFSYLGVIVALLLMRPTPPARGRQRGMLETLLEGLDFVWRTPHLLGLIVMAMVVSLLCRPYLQLLPVFARDILLVGAPGLGILGAAVGGGALAGGLAVATLGSFRKRGRLLLGSGLILGLTLMAFALSRQFPLSIALALLVGFSNTFFMSSTNSMLQTNTPDRLRGRVISLYTLIGMGFMPLGTLILGSLGSFIGVPLAVVLGAGVSLAVVVLVSVLVPKVRSLE